MKERFETTLKAVAKEELTENDTDAIEMIERFVDAETMDQIRQLQLGKLDLVNQLKEWRKKFWEDEEAKDHESGLEDRPGAKTLYLKDGAYQIFTNGGETITLSKGEVMSASEWGFWWKFDDTVPREDQTEIMSKQVRNLIAAEYDRQLIEYGSVDTLSDNYKRETYQAIKEKNLNLETMPSGILAEKMITSLLIKQMHDDPSLSFRIKSVDVYEDVEHKIDFILELKDYTRGVKVGEPHSFGIQFTLNPGATAKKEQQIERVKRNSIHETEVDDIMLITIPLSDVKEKYELWASAKKSKRDPRGPDNLWSEETKKTIIEGLLKRIEDSHHPYA
ncbi:hypothetical protein A3I99_00660 [Candidatus Kaiserbacteria bacterium RIFCSPLOWO2_02_FULL_45_11b]|uniref:Uncharacterized protein n=1 Tax=Candidatus Kaiserbacteria bacterium RIFCSPLOWO2_12_FULL_45_26 TaxID=1798525 RepID=A0A1F6FG72_9BACT|nr:MAG: hypothetical protein A2Z56_00920 [Candidatus Kaiserbacteria bacterium RIFCSPHIGHO2_12_45_16]OGG70954.1 MAG: hypothetical protein A2929_01075 [Candidatus Kaiserbacteria bacterium RIFCSPLOWO2_01_FULL_45_25]OGG84284.1 MAG: hypothetical protein A3I99_00660 [Candidatus Kaiserbacteria bacterium RIFCSPLOWO2_02_FULL_45_11b]OGG84863.1 MAG: hypothetical protein A3G90_02175 [Candidatus Kaiserbacteria bacterium RIFCSPLOWO2_12_FULL_45_26]